MAKKSSAKKELKILILAILAGMVVFSAIMIIIDKKEMNGFSANASEINYEQFQKKVENGEDFILMYSSTTCPACIKYKPILSEAIKETGTKDVYYIEIDRLNSSDRAELSDALDAEYTPTMAMFKDGVLQSNKMVGQKTLTESIDYINDYNELLETTNE